MSTDNVEDGGDISSGFGESTATGQVSDERAEQLLRSRAAKKGEGEANTPQTEPDAATEQEPPA